MAGGAAVTERDLFAGVCAAPDDDRPRLTYADFIEKSEPEYAEMIRLQVKRAKEERQSKAPIGHPDPREKELWLKHYAQWGHYIQRYCRDARVPDRYDQGWDFDAGSSRSSGWSPRTSSRSANACFGWLPCSTPTSTTARSPF